MLEDAKEKVLQDMDKLLSRIYGSERSLIRGNGSETRMPMADVQETENMIMADIELPGVDKEDIRLNVRDTSVEVKAFKREESEDEDNYSYRRYNYYRSIPLPERIDPDKVSARFRNGVLHVELPKSDSSRGNVKIE